MARPQVLEGTWEELKLHEEELSGKRFRLIPLPPEVEPTPSKARKPRENKSQRHSPQAPRRVTGMGKFAGILSSEEFLRQKQEDIELEERKFRG